MISWLAVEESKKTFIVVVDSLEVSFKASRALVNINLVVDDMISYLFEFKLRSG